MAPVPSAISDESSASQEFSGEEFSNNLFSDLAPLLALFGEQVTKQFLSLSLGWADNILIAMGPLGIITVAVSAVRVGGVKMLKAMVGRARESRSAAEAELLSSTSENVCELWSGREIVRALGSPEGMKELIIVDTSRARDSTKVQVLDLKQAVEQRYLRCDEELEPSTLERIADEPPNISLNVKNSTASPTELWGWAAVGTLFQLCGLVLPALGTYYWKWSKAGNTVAPYAYPCFVTGTVAVVLGIAFCSRVIEGSTTERNFTRSYRKGDLIRGVLRIQRSCTVSDQRFSSFVILNALGDAEIRTSRLNSKKYNSMAAAATLITVAGFIVQFTGLRALHWSATVVQMGVTLFMTAVRSWIRRGLSTDPICRKVPEGHELSWLALWISCRDYKSVWKAPVISSESLEGEVEKLSISWQVVTGTYVTEVEEKILEYERRGAIPNRAYSKLMRRFRNGALDFVTGVPFNVSIEGKHQSESTVSLHMQLQKLMRYDLPESELASRLGAAIESTMRILMNSVDVSWIEQPKSSLIWTVGLVYNDLDNTSGQISEFRILNLGVYADRDNTGMEIEDEAERKHDSWNVNRDETLAVLSLWLFTLSSGFESFDHLGLRTSNIPGLDIGSPPQILIGQGFIRIVGSRTYSECNYLSEDIFQTWIGAPVFSCRPPDRQSQSQIRNDELDAGRPPPFPWPVFGLQLSSIARYGHAVTDGRAASDSWTTSTARQAHSAIGDDEYTSRDFAVLSKCPLPQECAMELCSLFMLAVASKVKKVGGKTRSRRIQKDSSDLYGSEPEVYMWSNTVLSAIAAALISAELVENIVDANKIIIPAFARFGLLPTELNDVAPPAPTPSSSFKVKSGRKQPGQAHQEPSVDTLSSGNSSYFRAQSPLQIPARSQTVPETRPARAEERDLHESTTTPSLRRSITRKGLSIFR